jgi:hypothetical protein
LQVPTAGHFQLLQVWTLRLFLFGQVETILRLCVEVGGCLTGEHRVGVEKRDLMGVQFSEILSPAGNAAGDTSKSGPGRAQQGRRDDSCESPGPLVLVLFESSA